MISHLLPDSILLRGEFRQDHHREGLRGTIRVDNDSLEDRVPLSRAEDMVQGSRR